jgi:hypothetical protein
MFANLSAPENRSPGVRRRVNEANCRAIVRVDEKGALKTVGYSVGGQIINVCAHADGRVFVGAGSG